MRHRRTDLTLASLLTRQSSLLAWFSFGQANRIRLCGTLWWSWEGGPLWGLVSRLCGIYLLSPLLRSLSLSLFYDVDMLKTRQCLLWIRTFLGVTSRIWGFILCILRKHLRTVSEQVDTRKKILILKSSNMHNRRMYKVTGMLRVTDDVCPKKVLTEILI